MFFRSQFLLIVTLAGMALTGCAIFGGDKKPGKLELRYDKNSFINYGHSFKLEAYVLYNNGKEKEVTGKDELQIKIHGASYNNGWVSVDGYPAAFGSDVIKIDGYYTKDEISLSHALDIPFNYTGDLVVAFTGRKGSQGMDGEKGNTALLFRDGNSGDTGLNGNKGGDGDNLTVYVWKDLTTGLYKIKVTNLITNTSYYYKTTSSNYAIRFDVSGGEGGKGGNGGNGGDGKDGSSTEKKTKEPGDGGDGGWGGDGGSGGNGGNVYVFIHPNAAEVQSRITAYLNGGPGGEGGDGGTGGKGGAPLEGQTAGTSGGAGRSGNRGINGLPGTVFEVLVEEFDIES